MAIQTEPIAIVGIAAELPSGTYSNNNLDYHAFSKFLFDKGESYEKIPVDRFNIDALHGQALGQIISERGGFLKNLELFDYQEFGVSSKDARSMSVSTRKLLELTFLSLLDSGIDYRGRNVGSYMAGIAHDKWMLSCQDELEGPGSFSYTPSMIANRVSYHLDLRGPSLPTDTACSSSMTAMHLAVQALKNEECEAAVVGGCQINHRFLDWVLYSQGGILAPDGKCKPLDASADGFGRGEGAVVVTLKPLELAIRDHDRIYATILGTGINSSGSQAPPNAPVAQSQEAAMRRAFMQAGKIPKNIDFIELHATGTARGDPTEANWVGQAFVRDAELLVGSVKGNIGHLEITAFLASLCKVCIIFETGTIPPNVNFHTPNPIIRWEDYRLKVPLEAVPLPCGSPNQLSLISMASTGIGGANGHCVVESPPPLHSLKPFWSSDAVPCLFIAGGLSPNSLAETARKLVESTSHVESDRLRLLSTIYGRRSRSMTWRSFGILSPGSPVKLSEPNLVSRSRPPLVFVFSGQGPQYFDMGRQMFKNCFTFRASVIAMDKIYHSVTGESLITDIGLFDTRDDLPALDLLGDIWPIHITLPAIAILQIALFDSLVELGVTPDIVLGHSAGETAVLYASGSGCKEMAVELAIARGRAMSMVESHDGAMAALACTPTVAQTIIGNVVAELGYAPLDIGCYNSTDSVTLSGKASHIDNAVQRATDAGIFARRLRTCVPVHSSMMDACEKNYRNTVEEVFSRYPVTKPSVQMFSTMSGTLHNSPFSADYFWASTRGPVLFSGAISSLLSSNEQPSFLEIGPHPVLKSYLSALAGTTALVVCPLRRPRRMGDAPLEIHEFIEALGQLIIAGHNSVDFNVLNSCNTSQLETAPYPFNPKRIPIHLSSPSLRKARQQRNGLLNYPQLRISTQTHPYLAEHVIGGETIMPASGYIEMALEFGVKELYDVHFVSMLPLFRDNLTSVHVDLDGFHWKVSTSRDPVSSLPASFDHVHAEGLLVLDPSNTEEEVPLVYLEEIRQRCRTINMRGFYEGLKSFAQYGPQYRRVSACYIGINEALVEVRGNESDLTALDRLVLHPAILDASLHILVHPLMTRNMDKNVYYLPSAVKKFILHKAFVAHQMPLTVFAHVTLQRWTPTALEYDIILVDDEGRRLCTMSGFQVALHGQDLASKMDPAFELVLQPTDLSPELLSRPLSPSAGVDLPSLPDSDEQSLAVVYIRGQEMSLQKTLLQHSPDSSLHLWVTAVAGIDSNAAFGFVRSLRKEYKMWKIRLVVFDPSWSKMEVDKAMSLVQNFAPAGELEIVVDINASVLVPRIVPVEIVSDPLIAFDPSRPWVFDGSTIRHVTIPEPDEDHDVIEVLAASENFDGFWNFLGRSADSAQLQLGFSGGPISNRVCVHRGTIVEVQKDLQDIESLDFPLASSLAIAVLAIGINNFAGPHRIRNPILVTHADTVLASRIIALYSAKGLAVETISQHAAARDLAALERNRYEAIVSGYSANLLNLLERCTTRPGRVFTWSDLDTGIHFAMRQDPWSIGDAIRSALPHVTKMMNVGMKLPLEISSVGAGISVAENGALFSSNIHLLLGGIGSLGMRIALWMYQNGARRVILTSRSGRLKEHDILSARIFGYLQSIPDFSLRLVAADSTSEKDLRSLFQSISEPLGGCMLLSGVLSDRSFSQHSEETFEVPYAPKIQSLEVLAAVFDIGSLDYLITFGSVAGLFGNAGQTNYASANTLLEGMTSRYSNAFHVVVPALTDTIMGDVDNWRIKHYTNWGMTSREFCDHLRHAMRKFRNQSFATYIPSFDWRSVKKNLGPSSLYDHLVPEAARDDAEEFKSDSKGIAQIICDVLSLAIEDLSPEIPLTSYGLDSLSASTLSYALRPLLHISQIQLLADMTLKGLNSRLETAESEEAVALDDTQKKAQEMVKLLEKHTDSFPARSENRGANGTCDAAVLLTGSTGALGANILNHVLRESGFATVYCFCRPHPRGVSAADRHRTIFEEEGLDVSLLSSEHLVYLVGDLSDFQLGQTDAVYSELSSRVSNIIHSG